MRRLSLAAGLLAGVLLVPAYAAEDGKAKEWCNDAHMQKMDAMIAKMSDAAQQKSAESHLAMSKTAMQNGDMAGCVLHMEETHKAMGL